LILLLEELLVHIAAEEIDFQTPVEIFHDRKHKEWMNEALQTAYNRSDMGLETFSMGHYGRSLPVKRKFAVVASTETTVSLDFRLDCLGSSPIVQRRTLEYWTGAMLLENQVYCLRSERRKVRIDKPGGQLVDEFPDLPREIGSI
jgi:hypothetical protein